MEVVLPDVLGIFGRGSLPVVGQDNPQPGVEEGLFPQVGEQRLVVEDGVREDGGVGLKLDGGAGLGPFRQVADNLQLLVVLAAIVEIAGNRCARSSGWSGRAIRTGR